jgi:crotonobetainyl-CoA:carnitine CoA-transferase CaiB-like acyl-CoA transferase
MSAADDRPYAGLNVLDMSQGIAGPYCAALLAQHGANVIKIEPPEGDWIRVMGGGRDGMSALAIAGNLGKRSISIDAAKPAGRAPILKMAARADIFVENFRPGVMARLGLDYAALAAVNPGLIYLSITGFGPSGPDAHKPATDSVVQALTGMALINKDAAGLPRRFGILVPDTITALYAAQCVGAALYARDRQLDSGRRGKHITLSLVECCAAFQTGPILDDLLFAGQYKPPITVPAGVFATRDGHVVLATLRDAMWESLCRALERRDWLTEPRYATTALRGQCADEINREVAIVMRGRGTQEWARLFEQHDVLFAPVQTYAELRDDPQMRHMGYFGETDQAPYGKLPVPHAPGTARSGTLPAAPRSGEHSREILAEFGYAATDIAALERAGLVVQAN